MTNQAVCAQWKEMFRIFEMGIVVFSRRHMTAAIPKNNEASNWSMFRKVKMTGRSMREEVNKLKEESGISVNRADPSHPLHPPPKSAARHHVPVYLHTWQYPCHHQGKKHGRCSRFVHRVFSFRHFLQPTSLGSFQSSWRNPGLLLEDCC